MGRVGGHKKGMTSYGDKSSIWMRTLIPLIGEPPMYSPVSQIPQTLMSSYAQKMLVESMRRY